jgi:hypothetical protein
VYFIFHYSKLSVRYSFLSGGLSAGPLRAKAGKTMPVCAAAGVFGMLTEAWDLRETAATGPLPRFYLLCSAKAMSAKKRSG